MGKRGKTSPVPDRLPMVSRNSLSAARKVLHLAAISLLEKWDEVVLVGESKTAKEGREAKVKKAAFVAFGVFVAVSAAYVALLLC
jgi:hypothetical protein